jgi:hypothetical protein
MEVRIRASISVGLLPYFKKTDMNARIMSCTQQKEG